MSTKIIIKTKNYFPDFLYYGSYISLPAGMSLLFFSAEHWLGFFTTLVSFILLSTHCGLEINHEKQYYREFLWLMGKKFGEKKKFTNVEYIYINKNKVRQTYSTRVNSTTIIRYEYDAYVKFSDLEKVHLFSNENKTKLLKKLKIAFKAIKVEIKDYSEKIRG